MLQLTDSKKLKHKLNLVNKIGTERRWICMMMIINIPDKPVHRNFFVVIFPKNYFFFKNCLLFRAIKLKCLHFNLRYIMYYVCCFKACWKLARFPIISQRQCGLGLNCRGGEPLRTLYWKQQIQENKPSTPHSRSESENSAMKCIQKTIKI